MANPKKMSRWQRREEYTTEPSKKWRQAHARDSYVATFYDSESGKETLVAQPQNVSQPSSLHHHIDWGLQHENFTMLAPISKDGEMPESAKLISNVKVPPTVLTEEMLAKAFKALV